MFKESDEPNIYTDLSPDNKEPKLEKEKPEEDPSSESVRRVSRPGAKPIAKLTDNELKFEIDRLRLLIEKLNEEIKLRKENKGSHNIEEFSIITDEQLEYELGGHILKLRQLEQEKNKRKKINN